MCVIFTPNLGNNLTCAYFSCWVFQTNHQLSPKLPKCLGVEGFRQPNLHPELEFLWFGVYLQRWNLLPLSKKLAESGLNVLRPSQFAKSLPPCHPKAIHCCRFGIGESFQKIPGEIWNLNSAQKMSHYGTGFSARTDLSQMIWSCPASASKAFSATAKKPRARKKIDLKKVVGGGDQRCRWIPLFSPWLWGFIVYPRGTNSFKKKCHQAWIWTTQPMKSYTQRCTCIVAWYTHDILFFDIRIACTYDI